MDNIVRMTIFANSLLLSINDIFYFEAGILQPILLMSKQRQSFYLGTWTQIA